MPAFSALLTILPVLSAIIPQVYAWRPSDDGCKNNLCLTNFEWCDKDKKKDCYYPDNVYSREDEGGAFAALVWGREYEITWKVKDSKGNGDIYIKWESLSNNNGKDTLLWESGSMHPCNECSMRRS